MNAAPFRQIGQWWEELWTSPPLVSGWLAGWLGDRGERLAARYLRRHGYRIIARRYRTRMGEIDLIARQGEWLVFIEVKTRRSSAAGHPFEAVTAAKQRQLTRLAYAFLKRYRCLSLRARFDVVAVIDPGNRQPVQIEHRQNAFEPADIGQNC